MFTIELVVVRSGEDPEVIDRSTSPRHFFYDAEHRAKVLVREGKRRFPNNPPNGYRILDREGVVVVRSWGGADGKSVYGFRIPWGRLDNARSSPLASEAGTIYLEEDAVAATHRMEQVDVPVQAHVPCTLAVVARPAGRGRLSIDLRDRGVGEQAHATYDLEQARVMEPSSVAAIRALDGAWVRCELTMTPISEAAIVTLALLDQAGMPVYQGTDRAGVHLRPVVLYQHRAPSEIAHRAGVARTTPPA